ncbi:MAG TPA: GNAT family N-acetyltransferase [Lacipirellulaceae bacterium]|nr:GNAT family N-acetyltransferase [Lacipirellulaceae bacterium]
MPHTIAGSIYVRHHDLEPLSAVYHFRTFRNTDPPAIAQIWREQPQQRGLAQPITPGILEQFVFSKPYFDPAGLIVATLDGKPVGFAHAGFGPNDEHTALSTEIGTTYKLMLRAEHRRVELATQLLAQSESYLRGRGAKVIYAGGIRPLNAFYLGLYGGSELPGILASDQTFNDACRESGYREIDRVVVLLLELSTFRAPIARNLRQLRREVTFHETQAPRARDWWECCTTGAFERMRFHLARPGSAEPAADVWFWDVEPLSSSWGAPAAGMFDLNVSDSQRRRGLATFLLGEAFERLRTRGVLLVEAQTMQHNAPALALYQKLGFKKVDEGIVYRKDA